MHSIQPFSMLIPRLVSGVVALALWALLASTASAAPVIETFPATSPRGIVLVVHGGAWTITGEGARASMRPTVERFVANGWTAVNVGYAPGRQALPDVLAAYDAVEAGAGSLPVCLAGSSAGGHLALMTAVRRPSVDCVVSEGAPTDLVSITGICRTVSRQLWPEGVRAYSPTRRASRLRVPLLVSHARHDGVVPATQASALKRAVPRAELHLLSAGTAAYIHAPVDASDLARLHRAERRFLERVARSGSGPSRG